VIAAFLRVPFYVLYTSFYWSAFANVLEKFQANEVTIGVMRYQRASEADHMAWSPRYLVYPWPVSLPSVIIAMLRSDTGSDILGGYLFHPK
jgi:lysylphosphatidylglycerol synthetase-like protein (DUF2156 family)